MTIPAHGWHIERDVSPGTTLPHCLYIDGRFREWLTDEQADAWCRGTPAEPLPDGVTMRPVLDAGVPVPDGWLACVFPASRARRSVPMAVERIPAPATERVPWWEAKGRKVTDGLTVAEVGDDDAGPWWKSQLGVTTHTLAIDAHGMVTVLVQS